MSVVMPGGVLRHRASRSIVLVCEERRKPARQLDVPAIRATLLGARGHHVRLTGRCQRQGSNRR
ncbi:hypothetical protein HMPREF9577_00732 [Cutibacterium acnes HL110PA3]|nr:hypothetical protein HMPREF9577_00732 [Cutibacterium acnes HL110PA3]